MHILDRQQTQARWCSLLILSICMSLIIPLCPQPTGAAQNQTAMMTVCFGDGRVGLFWPPHPLFYKGGGWELQDRQSGKIVARWDEASLEQGLSSLDPDHQEKLRSYFSQMQTNKKQQKTMTSFLLMGGMSDFATARKLGMATVLHNVPAGSHRYRLYILDKHGKRIGRQISSRPVDSHIRTPLPLPINDLKGTSENSITSLFWTTPAVGHTIPAPLIKISRTGKDSKPMNITPEPVWISPDRDPAKAAYVDTMAPLETRLTYTIRRMDIFGRLSEPATVTVLNEDAAALAPPVHITAKAGEGEVELHWQAKKNPYTRGYVIERSRRENGLYEVLTPKGVESDDTNFTDKKVRAGFSYYYRVRSVGPRGDVGPAPDAVSVMVKNNGEPDSPEELKAEVQPTRVIMRWQAMPLPVAGYIIEKKKENTWVRINSRLATRPEFEDPINLGDYGERSYRVTAVAFGNITSDPAGPVTVRLPGHALIPPPTLLDISSTKGRVILQFQAGKPAQQTDGILLVRGNDIGDLGLIINRDLDGDAKSYTDKMVKPGEDYWYALIAVDKDGHHSKMSNKLFVIVTSSKIPIPDRPDAELKKKPFRRVVISFDKPEKFLRAAVMRKVSDGPWTTIAADIAGVDHIVDADPPLSGVVGYRLCYLDESRHWGEPSGVTTITMDQE